jgi:nicotinamidase-related amidase
VPDIAALPYPFNVPDLRQLALVVIDMQRDFAEPGGFGDALGNNVSLLRPAIAPIAALLAAFRAHRLPIVHTIEGHRPDLADCPPSKLQRGGGTVKIGDAGPMGRILVLGEPGNDIIPELAPLPGERVLTKPGKGAFCRTDLEAWLTQRGVTHLIITGVTTEVCVQTTMREANDRGFECLLVEDATESYFSEFKQATLAMVRAQGGIVGWTTTSGAVLQTLGNSLSTN